jgi:DinB superfamily
MNESFQEYKDRILSYSAGKKPLKVQASTAANLKKLIQRVPAAKLRKRPAADKWSITEIISHLAETEIVVGYRMRLILSAPGTPIIGFDQDKWAEAGHYAKRDPHFQLELFRSSREGNLALLKALQPDQWKLSGIHSERGEESIEKIAQMMAGHDLNHTSQIEAILGNKQRGQKS